MINVRSTRGKNSRGRKITGIDPMPAEEKVIEFLCGFKQKTFITYGV